MSINDIALNYAGIKIWVFFVIDLWLRYNVIDVEVFLPQDVGFELFLLFTELFLLLLLCFTLVFEFTFFHAKNVALIVLQIVIFLLPKFKGVLTMNARVE